jgi:acyl phosphate:glycerol-3-phosphate acyltransferase
VSQFAVAVLSGYLIGSIPTAYIIVRLFMNQDIRMSGSGSVGAANTLKVTKSKSLGILVGIFDILKGIAAFWVGQYAGAGEFMIVAAAGVAAVAGHNFPIWLKLKGGRGLATAAGFLLPWIWPAPIAWLLVWGITKKMIGNTHISNVTATGAILLFALVAKGEWLRTLSSGIASASDIRITALLLCGLIIIKHFEPIVRNRIADME